MRPNAPEFIPRSLSYLSRWQFTTYLYLKKKHIPLDFKSQYSKLIFKIKYNNLMSDRTRNRVKDYGKKK